MDKYAFFTCTLLPQTIHVMFALESIVQVFDASKRIQNKNPDITGQLTGNWGLRLSSALFARILKKKKL